MTNQEAIETIKLAQAQIEWEYPMDYAAAFDMAISALQAQELSETQNALDTISRQAAIDAADRADYTGLAVEDVKKVTDEVVKELKQLPSAQPDGEYISHQAVTESDLIDWYINSVDESEPVWTEEHIYELFNDFYLIPKED